VQVSAGMADEELEAICPAPGCSQRRCAKGRRGVGSRSAGAGVVGQDEARGA